MTLLPARPFHRGRSRALSSALAALAALMMAATAPSTHADTPAFDTRAPSFNPMDLLFPSASGWAAQTTGGRGGAIMRVTNLEEDGRGSLRAALEAEGPRIVVFEVGGVIDLDGEDIRVVAPDLTIAGQTAPAPGITLIGGGLRVAADNVIIQHLRIRPGVGDAEPLSGWEVDALSLDGAENVVIDHCSLSWGTDEVLSASGEEPSRRVSFSNTIIAEGLSQASHRFGEHSKGTLIFDGARDILLLQNLFAHNYERNPLFKGGTSGAVVNNLIFNPGLRALHYNHFPSSPRDDAADGALAAVGNVLRAGPSTDDNIAFFMIGGFGDVTYFAHDNVAVDEAGASLPALGRYTTSDAQVITVDAPPVWPEGLSVLPARAVEAVLLSGVGARPWDRDFHDQRLIRHVGDGHGAIIDHEDEVGGQREPDMTQRPFDPSQWDLDTMRPASLQVLFQR